MNTYIHSTDHATNLERICKDLHVLKEDNAIRIYLHSAEKILDDARYIVTGRTEKKRHNQGKSVLGVLASVSKSYREFLENGIKQFAKKECSPFRYLNTYTDVNDLYGITHTGKGDGYTIGTLDDVRSASASPPQEFLVEMTYMKAMVDLSICDMLFIDGRGYTLPPESIWVEEDGEERIMCKEEILFRLGQS